MEAFSYFIRSTIPNYFQSLPLPNSLTGFGSLSGIKNFSNLAYYIYLY
jgi:hypothetical protein